VFGVGSKTSYTDSDFNLFSWVALSNICGVVVKTTALLHKILKLLFADGTV
jgi:hypothetical protein